MSLHDFCSCTPAEFQAILEKYTELQNQQYKTHWEQTRTTCLCLLQPHARQTLTPSDILQFPWDISPNNTKKADDISPADLKARYKAMKQKLGLK